MGDVHDWATCRCQLCLSAQRLLLLIYNEKLGEEFSRTCVRRLREVYLELLDEAERNSREGVGRATYSTPAFKEEGASRGSATSLEAKAKKAQASVKGERSEEEEDTSAAGEHREGEDKATPVSPPTRKGGEEKQKRSRSRHRRRRSSEKKSSRKDRSNSRGRSKRSRSYVCSKEDSRKTRSPASDTEHQSSAKASSEPPREPRVRSPPKPSRFDPAARRAAPPPSSWTSSRVEPGEERKDRDKVLPRRKLQEPDHPPPGHRDEEDWSSQLPKSREARRRAR